MVTATGVTCLPPSLPPSQPPALASAELCPRPGNTRTRTHRLSYTRWIWRPPLGAPLVNIEITMHHHLAETSRPSHSMPSKQRRAAVTHFLLQRPADLSPPFVYPESRRSTVFFLFDPSVKKRTRNRDKGAHSNAQERRRLDGARIMQNSRSSSTAQSIARESMHTYI